MCLGLEGAALSFAVFDPFPLYRPGRGARAVLFERACSAVLVRSFCYSPFSWWGCTRCKCYDVRCHKESDRAVLLISLQLVEC